MIVSKNENFTSVIKLELESFGVIVESVSSEKEVIESYQNYYNYDLIFLDFLVDDFSDNGLSLKIESITRNPAPPIILVYTYRNSIIEKNISLSNMTKTIYYPMVNPSCIICLLNH